MAWVCRSIGFWKNIKLNMSDMYGQEWSENIFKSNKCIMSHIIKNEPVFEEYLLNNSIKSIIIMCKFYHCKRRKSLHLCNLNLISDEFHYLFMCIHI